MSKKLLSIDGKLVTVNGKLLYLPDPNDAVYAAKLPDNNEKTNRGLNMSQVLLMLDGNILQYTSNGETYTLQIDESLTPKRVDSASALSNPEDYAEGSVWVQGGGEPTQGARIAWTPPFGTIKEEIECHNL